jgi:subtilisin family serine protease
MPIDEPNGGGLFGDYPPYPPGRDAGDDIKVEVQRQVSELAQSRYEPAARHEMLRVLQARREDGKSGKGITQFDFLPVEVGSDIAFVRGEILITGRSYDGRGASAVRTGQERYAQGYLDALGLEARDVECEELRGRVLRLTPSTPLGPQELADLARTLQLRGFAASLAYLTPTAGVIKPPPRHSPNQPAPSARVRRSVQGKPAKVAIIDTGITAEKRTDGFLDTVPRPPGDIDPLHTFPFPAGDGYLDLEAGHGTYVAGLVQQVAPEADITVYRAVDSDGIASEVTVACEMIRAVKEGGAQILNLSLGCQTLDDMPPIAIAAALEIIGEWERETGREVLIVAAAGNYGDTRPCWPAAFRRVVSVGGLSPDLLPLPFSSHGFWVTCSTVGQGLTSTFVEGELSPVVSPAATVFGPDAWAVWSGTSFAAPQIAGALARLSGDEGISLREALRRLLAAGQEQPGFGRALQILPGI